MAVDFQHPDYGSMAGKWQRCRDVTCGQDAVHAAGERYLPKLKDQAQEDYLAYVKRAPFYNATWRTVAGLVGMIFRKPPKVETPEQVKESLDDVTMDGVPLQMLAQEVVEEALKLGRVGILCDYPTAEIGAMTLADAQAQNLRPMLHTYRAENVINWKTGRVNNVTVLTMVVLKEISYVQKDEFGTAEETRFRVLDLEPGSLKYRVRLFRKKPGTADDEQIGGDVYPLMNGKPMDYIPFTFIGVDDNTPEVDEPPLIDLVDLNLSHYRNSADLEHGAHFTGLPTAVVSGYTPDKEGEKLYIGSSHAWLFPKADTTASYLEFRGEGLGALERLKEAKEKQMAVLGARMLEQQQKAKQSAESQSVQRKGEESMLSSASQAIAMGIERALKWFVEWSGADPSEVKFELNREFYPTLMTDAMLSALVSAWQSGAISDQVLFDNLQTGDIIDQGTTLEEEQAARENSAPAMSGGLPDASPGGPGFAPGDGQPGRGQPGSGGRPEAAG